MKKYAILFIFSIALARTAYSKDCLDTISITKSDSTRADSTLFRQQTINNALVDLFDNATIADSLYSAYKLAQQMIAYKTEADSACRWELASVKSRNNELDWQVHNLIGEVSHKAKTNKVLLILLIISLACIPVF